MPSRSPRQRFRSVLTGDACVRPASVFDPLTARAAAELGFEAGMLAGSVASLVILGAPDLTLITLSELADLCRRICRASDLPLLVDADHGYGNALNVMRTLEELEAAGVAALTVEDTQLPATFGGPSDVALIGIEEGAAKIRAAVAARRDPDLVIVGRTAAPAITGVEDAVQRCLAFRQAGADAVFLTGCRTRSDLEIVAAAVPLPVLIGNPSPVLDDTAYLSSVGVRLALQSHAPVHLATSAACGALEQLRRAGQIHGADLREAEARVRALSRSDTYARWTDEFLRKDG